MRAASLSGSSSRQRRRVVLAAIARRKWLLHMLALAAAAGCRRDDDPAYSRGNTLVMAYPEQFSLRYDDLSIQSLYLPRLAAPDENGDLRPLLAERWEHSADYREATYHLRTDVRWSDGAPVTAHDVKFTLDLLSHPDVHYANVDAVTVVDDYTVTIRRRAGAGAGAGPDGLGWVYHLPKHVLEGLQPSTFWDWDYWTHPAVSAGPYRFVRYVPETMMEFEASPRYYRNKPRIERVVLKFAGQVAGLNELLSGNVDVVYMASASQIASVSKDARIQVHTKVWHFASAIYWKCDHPLFRDPSVRRALTLAIDRRALLGVVNLPGDLPITDGVFTERQFLRRQYPEPLPHDPAQARALLEAAGWHDQDGDGVREREGRPFRFTAIGLGDQDVNRLAVYVQAQLREVGVEMHIQTLDIGAVWQRFTAGDFEAVFHIHQPGPGEQRRDFGKGNRIGYQNPEVVRLTDQAVATADPDELDRIYSDLTSVLRADLPVTHLVPYTSTSFAHRRVRGPGTPFLAMPDKYMEELWLVDREKR